MKMPGAPRQLLFLITGSQGTGKTTFCQRLVEAARESGWRATGLLSHPVFDGSQRVAIEAENLTNGDRRRLAVRSDELIPVTRYWQFDNDAVAWGNQILADSTPTDLLVIDELGALEFEREAGWQAGLAAADSRQYAVAVVVVRSELLGEALLRWDDAYLVEIDTHDDSLHKAQVLANQLF